MNITVIQNFNPEGAKPHFRGFVKIDGAEYEFAAWPAKSGKPGVFTGKLSPKKSTSDSKQQAAQSYQKPISPPDLDDEIPF